MPNFPPIFSRSDLNWNLANETDYLQCKLTAAAAAAAAAESCFLFPHGFVLSIYMYIGQKLTRDVI